MAMSIDAIPSRSGVEAAIHRASSRTGVDFDYLMRTAQRESAMNPLARARTSSAAGLFQFIEQTWLATLKTYGPRHGYGQYADLIQRGADGRWRVEGSARNVVMDLRYDPHAASTMAAELTSANAAYLRGRTGREPTAGDLYAAHFLGPAGAARLIEEAAVRPHASAAALFPQAAAANRSIFYRDGRPATVAEVRSNLARSAGQGAPAAPAAPSKPVWAQDGASGLDPDRLQRLAQERALLALLLGDGQGDGQGAGGGVGFGAAFTGGYGDKA